MITVVAGKRSNESGSQLKRLRCNCRRVNVVNVQRRGRTSRCRSDTSWHSSAGSDANSLSLNCASARQTCYNTEDKQLTQSSLRQFRLPISCGSATTLFRPTCGAVKVGGTLKAAHVEMLQRYHAIDRSWNHDQAIVAQLHKSASTTRGMAPATHDQKRQLRHVKHAQGELDKGVHVHLPRQCQSGDKWANRDQPPIFSAASAA